MAPDIDTFKLQIKANDLDQFNNCAELLESFISKETTKQKWFHHTQDRVLLRNVRVKCSRGNCKENFISQGLMKRFLLQEVQCRFPNRRIGDGVFKQGQTGIQKFNLDY